MLLVIGLLSIAACGGGGSDSGGEQDQMRTFVGTGPLIGTTTDGLVVEIVDELIITISGSALTISDDLATSTGSLNSDGVSFVIGFDLYSNANTQCDNPVTMTGVIFGSNIQLTHSGSATCVTSGITFSVIFTGEVTLTET